MISKGVIVLGGHVQGYGIVRIFGEAGISVTIVDDDPKNIARHSRYCNNYIKCNYTDLVKTLLKLGSKGDHDGHVIFPTDDYYVKILSQNKQELEKYFRVTVDEWAHVDLFYNKSNSYPLVANLNIPIPETYYPKSSNDVEVIADSIRFPCIIKPSIMLDFYRRFKTKVFICNSKVELIQNFEKTRTQINTSDILIQEIIPGGSRHQYSVGAFAVGGEIVTSITGRRLRQHPIDFGNATTFAETVDIPILREYAAIILHRANYFGLCEVEFKYDSRDGEFKFLEVNPRSWKWHLIAYAANQPILTNIYKYLNNQEIQKPQLTKSASWQDITTDLPIVIQLFIKRMFNASETNNCIQAVFNLKDIRPFIMQLIYLPYNFFKR